MPTEPLATTASSCSTVHNVCMFQQHKDPSKEACVKAEDLTFTGSAEERQAKKGAMC